MLRKKGVFYMNTQALNMHNTWALHTYNAPPSSLKKINSTIRDGIHMCMIKLINTMYYGQQCNKSYIAKRGIENNNLRLY